jgi:hypothetical protein
MERKKQQAAETSPKPTTGLGFFLSETQLYDKKSGDYFVISK